MPMPVGNRPASLADENRANVQFNIGQMEGASKNEKKQKMNRNPKNTQDNLNNTTKFK